MNWVSAKERLPDADIAVLVELADEDGDTFFGVASRAHSHAHQELIWLDYEGKAMPYDVVRWRLNFTPTASPASSSRP